MVRFSTPAKLPTNNISSGQPSAALRSRSRVITATAGLTCPPVPPPVIINLISKPPPIKLTAHDITALYSTTHRKGGWQGIPCPRVKQGCRGTQPSDEGLG